MLESALIGLTSGDRLEMRMTAAGEVIAEYIFNEQIARTS